MIYRANQQFVKNLFSNLTGQYDLGDFMSNIETLRTLFFSREFVKVLLSLIGLLAGSAGISTQLTMGVFTFWYIIYQELSISLIGSASPLITILLSCLMYMGIILLIALWVVTMVVCMKHEDMYRRITQAVLLLALGMIATNYTDPRTFNPHFITTFWLHTMGSFAILFASHSVMNTVPEPK